MGRRTAAAMTALCLIVVAACRAGTLTGASSPPSTAGASADTAGSAAPLSTPGSPHSPAPRISATPGSGATPTAAASPPTDTSTLDVPADWAVYSWSDGVAGIALPPGWEPGDLDAALADARAALPSTPPDQARTLQDSIARLESGSVRLSAQGPLPGDMWPGSWLEVTVETGDASLDAFVARLVEYQTAVRHSTGITTRGIVTPVGPAVELRYLSGPQTDGAHDWNVHAADVALYLPDGRSETISLTGNGTQEQIDTTADAIIATIHDSRAGTVAYPAAPDGARDPARAVTEAVARLGTLGSYRFVSRADNRIPTEPSRGTGAAVVFRATLNRSDGLSVAGSFGLAMGEGAASGDHVYAGYPVVVGHGRAWMWGQTDLEETPLDQAMKFVGPCLPDAVVEHLVSPFASGYELVDHGMHAGVAAAHYRATADAAGRYAQALAIEGTVTADLWIADQGGYLVGLSIDGVDDPQPRASAQFPVEVVIRLDIISANDPLNEVELPTP